MTLKGKVLSEWRVAAAVSLSQSLTIHSHMSSTGGIKVAKLQQIIVLITSNWLEMSTKQYVVSLAPIVVITYWLSSFCQSSDI